MYLIKFAFDEPRPTAELCGSLESVTQLFGVLATTPNMLYVQVTDSDGEVVRNWTKKKGYCSPKKAS